MVVRSLAAATCLHGVVVVDALADGVGVTVAVINVILVVPGLGRLVRAGPLFDFSGSSVEPACISPQPMHL